MKQDISAAFVESTAEAAGCTSRYLSEDTFWNKISLAVTDLKPMLHRE